MCTNSETNKQKTTKIAAQRKCKWKIKQNGIANGLHVTKGNIMSQKITHVSNNADHLSKGHNFAVIHSPPKSRWVDDKMCNSAPTDAVSEGRMR